jgi:hypothetical protein
MKKPRKIRKTCIQCGNEFTIHPSDLEEETDWRFCSEECEAISALIDKAEISREEREDR